MSEPVNDENPAVDPSALSAGLGLIRSRQTRYAANFARDNWHEDELSDIGWLCLVAVPWLLAQLDGDGNNQGNNRNGNSYPRTNSVGLPEASLKLMLPKNSVSDSSLVVITGNPSEMTTTNELEQKPRSGLSDLAAGLGVWISVKDRLPDSSTTVLC